jgi:F-type H+-transporting ATPase subunit a
MDIRIEPEVWFKLKIFGMELHISDSICVTWIISAILVIAALIVRFALLGKFKDVPKGIQNVIELMVEKLYEYCDSYMNGRGDIAPYIGTLALYLGLANTIELVGLRPPTTNISTTFAMSIITFILINYYGVRQNGILGRLKHYTKPVAILAPIKLITDLAVPISLASRMFGNILASLVVMDIIYNVMKFFAIGIPAALAIYFNLFDGLMQTFIFVTLTLVFVREGME